MLTFIITILTRLFPINLVMIGGKRKKVEHQEEIVNVPRCSISPRVFIDKEGECL